MTFDLITRLRSPHYWMSGSIEGHDGENNAPREAADLIEEMVKALVEAKRELWATARSQWTMEDFKNWAVVEQIDAALDKARATSSLTSPVASRQPPPDHG